MPVVLVVDDEPHLRKLIQDVLEVGGCAVVTRSRAESALALLRDKRVDLVIADADLGAEMDGLGLARVIRRHGPPCPVILITENAMQRVEADLVSASLAKPFTSAGLIAAVKRSLHEFPQVAVER